jgi:putative hydrolase of the HAD superfamily
VTIIRSDHLRDRQVLEKRKQVRLRRQTCSVGYELFMPTKQKPKALFFDAVGTLFYLTRSVGEHYALVGSGVGLKLDADQLDRAFASAWNRMPSRPAIDGPRPDDDKGWWRQLVDLVLDQVGPSLNQLDRDNFFEVAYDHFAEAGVWELYPEVPDVLEKLQPRFQLAVISNFDGRLRFILEHLGILRLFHRIFISSELGADKPDPEIYRRALAFVRLEPTEVLHVGDDPERDWKGATAAGLSIFQLDRRKNSLRDLLSIL